MSLKEPEPRTSYGPSETSDNFGGELARYTDIPPLARWKTLIIEHGVDFEDASLFNGLEDIASYKTKRRVLKPIARGLKVFDESEDPSLMPSELIICCDQKTSIVKLGYKQDSPLQIDLDEEQGIVLREKATQKTIPIEINLVKRREYQDVRVPGRIDPDRTKLVDFIDVVGLDRLSVITFDGCWNWNCGKPCSFCDYNPKRQDHTSAKPSTNTLRDFDGDVNLWWSHYQNRYLAGMEYAFKYILDTEDLSPHQHLLIMSGNLPISLSVWNNALDVVETLNKVRNVGFFDNYLNICPHPDVEVLQRARGLGIKQVQYNLEVIGPEVFAGMCPGKMDYSTFIARLEEAVCIMGFGNVRSNFVLGIQPVEQLLEGIRDLAKKGVVADYSIFQPKRGTPMADHPAPTMDTIVSFTKELVRIYKEYGFHGIYCNLSSRSSIINECL